MLIVPPPIRKSIVDLITATGGPYETVTVGLFLSTYTPSVNSTYAELDAAKATFSGYAAEGPVVWEGPFIDANNVAYMLGQLINFVAVTATPFIPNLIGGYYLYTGTTLKGVESFTSPVTGLPTPVAVTAPDFIVPVIPRFSFGQ